MMKGNFLSQILFKKLFESVLLQNSKMLLALAGVQTFFLYDDL